MAVTSTWLFQWNYWFKEKCLTDKHKRKNTMFQENSYIFQNHVSKVNSSKKLTSQTYPETCQTSEMKRFVKIVNSFMPLTLFAKCSTLDVWHGCKHASALPLTRSSLLRRESRQYYLPDWWRLKLYRVECKSTMHFRNLSMVFDL